MKRYLLLLCLLSAPALAQVRMPAFIGGAPGMAQMNAIVMQRHQARTLLYREALEELRKNPAAADVPACPPGAGGGERLCLAQPAAGSGEATTPAGDAERGRRLAVLFGNNRYPAPIPPLETPRADIEAVAALLRERFGFVTELHFDASKATIVETLNKLAAQARTDDRVLVFYAGHGYLLDDIRMGFWIPIDASVKTAANWISNNDIGKLLKAIPARQLLLVSDSCFSGTLTQERAVSAQGDPAQMLRQRTVVALSSGDDEPVSDEGQNGHSVFAWNLMQALREVGQLAPGTRVWQDVRTRVKRSAMQVPQYGAVVSAGHVEGGDWLFVRP